MAIGKRLEVQSVEAITAHLWEIRGKMRKIAQLEEGWRRCHSRKRWHAAVLQVQCLMNTGWAKSTVDGKPRSLVARSFYHGDGND